MTDGGDWVNAAASTGESTESGVSEGAIGSALRVGDPLVAAYRHDVHKLRGRRHSSASGELYGVPVNEQVPLGADGDAALLSRPRGEPEETVANHVSPYRLSLLSGEAAVETRRIKAAAGGGFRELVTPSDPEVLHARWVTSPVPAAFNESVYHPYTSLKYHTLLVAALLDNYRDGYGFDELYLAVSSVDSEFEATGEAAIAVDAVEPFRTVLWMPGFALHVTGVPGGRPAASLGAVPAQSFADVWARLPAHPFDTDGERWCRVLDAQLRRVRSWSSALQYIEEYVAQSQADAGRDIGGGVDAV